MSEHIGEFSVAAFAPFDDPLAYEVPEPSSEIALGLTCYGTAIRRLGRAAAGGEDEFLTRDQERLLAHTIQAGNRAEEQVAVCEARINELDVVDDKVMQEYLQELRAANQGKKAHTLLVEGSLRFAAYVARLSMGFHKPEAGSSQDYSEQQSGRPGKSRVEKPTAIFRDIAELRTPNAELEDRIQLANIGLIKAARKFSPSDEQMDGTKKKAPARFMTYARWWIEQEIARSIPYETSGFRLPEAAGQELREYMREQRGSDDPLLGRYAAWSEGRYTEPLDEITFDASPEEVEDDWHEPEQLTIADVFPASGTDHLLEELDKERLKKVVDDLLGQLDERDAGIISMRFGLFDQAALTLDEVGMAYGVTRERIRQVESKAMAKLRRRSYRKELADYLQPDSSEHQSQYVVGGDRLKLGRTLARSLETDELTADEGVQEPRELWQAYPGEEWEEPVRT